jgi:hypothetical protein
MGGRAVDVQKASGGRKPTEVTARHAKTPQLCFASRGGDSYNLAMSFDHFWLLTWTTYGSWLPGDARGSVTAVKNAPGARRRNNIP